MNRGTVFETFFFFFTNCKKFDKKNEVEGLEGEESTNIIL